MTFSLIIIIDPSKANGITSERVKEILYTSPVDFQGFSRMGGSNGSLRGCFNHEKILEEAIKKAQRNIQCSEDKPCSTKVPKYFTKQFMVSPMAPLAYPSA